MRLSLIIFFLPLTLSNIASADEPSPRYSLSTQGQAVLGEFGLDAIQPITVGQAQEVRGTGGSAATRGHSFLSAMIMDGESKSYVFGIDTNMGFANITQGGVLGPIDPFHEQQSNLGLALEVGNLFNGVLLGGAGGRATAFYR